MGRGPRVILSIGVAIAAVPVVLLGLGLLWYQGDGPGADPYVELAGSQIDAQVLGALLLLVALAALGFAVWLARRREARFARPSSS